MCSTEGETDSLALFSHLGLAVQDTREINEQTFPRWDLFVFILAERIYGCNMMNTEAWGAFIWND